MCKYLLVQIGANGETQTERICVLEDALRRYNEAKEDPLNRDGGVYLTIIIKEIDL